MIDELITALSKEMEMSTDEIADTIWLALQIQESSSESVSSDFSLVKEDRGAIENKIALPKSQPQTPDSNETRKNPDLEMPKAKIYPQSQQQTESLDLSFKTPNAPSLRQPLTLARALKPLMRRIPAGRNFVLDETATIEHIAITNARSWLPVLRPTLEPWLDLELVVDESISMQIWRQTIRDLEKLLKNYGIFRDVRVWGMTVKDGKVEIRRGIGAAANKFPRSTKELIDGSSRRLVLVVSDCVSSYWRDGTVTKVLEIWGNSVPTAIIQMLPKWLWKRTALGRASEVRLRGLTPGVSNQNLIAQEVSLWEELEEKKGVKVPVFTLEEDKAKTWAQMLSGKSSVWSLGFLFKLDAPVQENSLFNLDYGKLSAEERVQAFRVTASPMARKLGGLLAAAPVISLPVVRLIRAALLPECLQVNVAEVFLGGLLKPLSEIKVENNPDEVLYEFMDGVRELLIDSMPTDRVLNVVDKVSEYVAERVGLSLEDFAAVLRGEKEVEDSGVVGEVGYFATVTAQVLRRLGGEYEKVAEELMVSRNFNKRLQDLKDNIAQDLELLKEYEIALRYATNPRQMGGDHFIKRQKESVDDYEQQYSKLKQELADESSAQMQTLEKQLQALDDKINVLLSGDEAKKAIGAIQQLHPKNKNPFTVGQPVLPEKFVGRKYEINSAFDQIMNRGHVAISAPPGMGKTSLLKYLASPQAWQKEQLDPSKAIIVLLSCKNIIPFTSSGFWVEVLKLMRDKLDDEPKLQVEIETLLEEGKNTLDIKNIGHILNMLGAREKFLLLLVDDYDFALQTNDHYTETDMQIFLSENRNLAVHSPEGEYIMTVVATLRRLNELRPPFSLAGSPWYNHYLFVKLKPFTETEVDRLLALDISITSELKEAIQKFTGTHPALLQLAGSLLHTQSKVGDFFNYEELIANFESQTRELFQRTWYQCNEDEQALLVLIALSAVKSRLKNKMPFDLSSIDLTLSQREPELIALKLMGIVSDSLEGKQKYSFASLIMESWVIQKFRNIHETSMQKIFLNLMSKRKAKNLLQIIKWLQEHQEEVPTFLEYTSSLAKLFSSLSK